MKPEDIAKQGSETAHQVALFCWAAQELAAGRYKELVLLHHIPNGGSRHKAEAATLKAAGVKAGVLDLFLPVPKWHVDNGVRTALQACGLYIEMKAPTERNKRNGGLSDQQVLFGNAVADNGYAVACCYTWEEARDTLLAYLS